MLVTKTVAMVKNGNTYYTATLACGHIVLCTPAALRSTKRWGDAFIDCAECE